MGLVTWVRALAALVTRRPRPAQASGREQRLIAGALSGGDATLARQRRGRRG